MKKLILCLVLALSITAPLFAQKKTVPASGADKTFELDPDRVRQRLWIDLGKGNKLRLELQSPDDLSNFHNMDSLLIVFINDMKAFKDSLSDPLPAYRVDYVIDTQDRKKIRIRKQQPTASSFVLNQGEPASLKLEQDTINIIMVTRATPNSIPRWDKSLHHSRLTFYLNQYQDLENYVTGGLNAKINWLENNPNAYWVQDGENGYHAKQDFSISGAMPRGSVKTATGSDYLASTILLSVGNYKNYFVPAFSLGFTAWFKRPSVTHAFGLYWEPNFLFSHNAEGAVQTFRNDFLTLSYMRSNNHSAFFQGLINLDPSMSVSYLIHREGEYFDKNTFRLTFGSISIKKNEISLDPGMYFNNFFRGVTPSLQAHIRL